MWASVAAKPVVAAAVALLVAVVGAVIWGSGKISMQGERVVYTAACTAARWDDGHCAGRLVAAARYRFQAIPSRREVRVWSGGKGPPDGIIFDCNIVDAWNWTCPTAPRGSIAIEMHNGRPVFEAAVTSAHVRLVTNVPRYALRVGLTTGRACQR